MYSPQLLDYFQNPRNPGDVENADASVQLDNPVCGDVLRLSLRVKDDVIVEIRFKARGCVPAMACGSALTELAQGLTLSQARALTQKELVQKVGGLPDASDHAAMLAMDALASALRQVKK